MLEFNATFVLVLVSFVVFMLLMKGMYFDPVAKIKLARAQQIDSDKANALRYASDTQRMQEELALSLAEARKKAHQLIQDKRQAAKQSADSSRAQAKSSAAQTLAQQMTELAQWRETTYGQLTEERTALANLIVTKVTAGVVVDKIPLPTS